MYARIRTKKGPVTGRTGTKNEMAEDNEKNKDKGKGNESDSKKTNTNTNAFDPKELSDEDITKVFDDPRIWEHKRFKELNESAKEAKKLAKKLEEKEETELKEQEKYEELAEKYKERAEKAEKALEDAQVENALTAEASKQGARDLEAVLKLVDRSGIELDKDGNITGIDKAVEGLLEGKPYLKDANASNQNIGSGTNPGQNNDDASQYTLSQIQDPEFYQEHKDEIMQAYKRGQIIDDTGQATKPAGPLGPQK